MPHDIDACATLPLSPISLLLSPSCHLFNVPVVADTPDTTLDYYAAYSPDMLATFRLAACRLFAIRDGAREYARGVAADS